MATQTGSIDLEATNAAKLYAEAGFTSAAETYATKSELTVAADSITSDVSSTYATKAEVKQTASGTGTAVSVEDGAGLALISLHIDGQSVQDGTPTPENPVAIKSVESRNLAPIGGTDSRTVRGVEFSCSDGAFKVAGTFSAAPNDYVYTYKNGFKTSGNYASSLTITDDNSIALPAGTYELSGQFNVAAGNVRLSIRVGAVGTTGTVYHATAAAPSVRFTIDASAHAILAVGTPGTANVTVDVEITNVMLASTDNVAYQPYGCISIVSDSKNLLDVSSITGSTTVKGITWTANGDGTFNASGTATANSVLGIGAFMFKDGQTYTLSGCPSGGSATDYEIMVQQSTATTSGGWRHDYGSGATFNGNGEYRRIQLVVRNGQTVDITFAPMIEYGSTATEYEPYQGITTPIDLQGDALRSLPDGTHDELDVDAAGNVVLTQRVGVTDTATTDAITATVGVDAMSTTGTLADGATVIYPLATPQIVNLGTIEMPSIESDSTVWVDAEVTPEIAASWWTESGYEVGRVSQRTSALEQTSDGFSIRISGLDGAVEDIGGELSGLADGLADLTDDAVLKSRDEWTAWLDIGTDSSNDPYLSMGQTGNAFQSRLTNRDMAFYEGTNELMRLSGEDGVKADVVRSKQVYVGSWIIEELDSGDLAIKLIGGS